MKIRAFWVSYWLKLKFLWFVAVGYNGTKFLNVEISYFTFFLANLGDILYK